MRQQHLIRKFDRQAKIYEKKRRRKSESKWREQLFSLARGHTLELSVGAGANFPFYPENIDVTAVDFSPRMLEKAKEADHNIPASFIQDDVEALDFEPDTFDTIVSSMSFCGYENPAHVLSLCHQWIKPGGHLLLMEHGLSTSTPLAQIQKSLDPLSVKVVGCHQNRSIQQLVEESPFTIERYERKWFGIFHLVWARKESSLT
ncbi:class I SAM-dependent methyltransferase [Salicibibacter halophilus]|uniref:Class I SAM-dependent methyltransferase n=1 Tax=Salicibibacter halophilus TaxID=2502791 RepID=A0A514LF77_9BACI|nr:class I SAM-dependent methyltransferase [Salicibibacter halophilus]QDI90473.1 class I SAM-dependent methyltransferase [Salicibibacter halophilus]